MKIQFYGYNAFLIESGDKMLAIDPGALFFYWFRFPSLFPKSIWQKITHIFVTHGDPDHYWYADKMAESSGAPIIINQTMLHEKDGKVLALGPRSKGLAFTTEFKNVRTLSVDETLEMDGMVITGVKATHGELVLKLGPFKAVVRPGPGERIGWGAMGFDITVNGKRILTLGDTLLLEQEWEKFIAPDLLLIPIGGKEAHNTMDEEQAIRAVKSLKPGHVIPCHYNCPGLFSKQLNPADAGVFKRGVESVGAQCSIMKAGDTIVLNGNNT